MFTLRETDRKPFERALAKANAVYDEEWKAPAGYLDKANYHTNLARQTVHSTRDAFGYAAALLASGREEDLSRAEEILWNVSAQQDKNPANATYGIWSWYMEEPLEKMSPPDWNWADFCGKEILQVLAFHGDRISKDLRAELEDALRHACLSIFRRNMHAAYTNISIMGSYVTLHAGQLLGWPWLFSYGKERFRGFVRYTRGNHGAFAEYNSATYTSVAIEDLTRIHTHIRDGEVHAMAGEMLDDAWRTIADHFHAPTRQWCGPNARSYTWLTAPGTLSFLEQATGHGISLTDFNGDKSLPPFSYSLGWAYVDLCCPDKYRKAFCEPEEKDVNVVFRTEADLRTSPAAVAVFHKEKDFALGSFAAVSAWNQRRGFLAFWGGERPRFLNLAALHNLYDFSSGMFTIAQDGGHALILASLRSDSGDTHINLDMIKNGRINAYDLRIRLEAGGALEGDWMIEDDAASLADGGRRIGVRLIGAEFDGAPCRLEKRESREEKAILDGKPDLHRRFTGAEERRYLDVVFYEGPEKEINLTSLSNAYAALFVSLDGTEPEATSLTFEGDNVLACAICGGTVLEVSSPVSPARSSLWRGEAKKNGVTYEKLYGEKS